MRSWMMALGLAAAVVLSAPGQAKADWQWTKWGMTRDQLVEASGGRAQKAPSQVNLATFDGVFQAGGFTFKTVTFSFDDNGKLVSVNLFDPDASFRDVSLALRSVMGPPVMIIDDEYSKSEYFVDPAKGNVLELEFSSRTVRLTYRAMPTGF